MLAYFIVTASLILVVSFFSLREFIVSGLFPPLVRFFGELAIAGWGFWLAYRVLA